MSAAPGTGTAILAVSDTEAFVYRFSWDKGDLQSYPWSERYVKHPEVLVYLRHIVKHHNLRIHMQLSTELLSATYDETERLWKVQTSAGPMQATYLITAMGILSTPNWPDMPGLHMYKRELYHTHPTRRNSRKRMISRTNASGSSGAARRGFKSSAP